MPDNEEPNGGETLEEMAERLANLKLDTLISRGRDRMRIRLANDADLDALAADIELGPWVKATLGKLASFCD